MSDFVLLPWGRSTWADTFGRVAAHTWLWCDLTGAHLEAALPDRFPRATHVWGWAEGSWIRLRLDGPDLVIGARLQVAGPGVDGTVIAVTIDETRTWQLDEKRVSVADKLRGRLLRRLVTQASSPLTFLALEGVV